MPFKQKSSENYRNLGGINRKTSPYLTGPQQFLNMVNMDFSTPGSLTQRPGSTMWFFSSVGSSLNFGGRIDGLVSNTWDYTSREIDIISARGTTGTNLYVGRGFGIASLLTFSTGVGATQFFMSIGHTYVVWPVRDRVLDRNYQDFAVYGDYLYSCDGIDFIKFPGTLAQARFAAIPPVIDGVTAITGSNSYGGTFVAGNSLVPTNLYKYVAAYKNSSLGVFGPWAAFGTASQSVFGATFNTVILSYQSPSAMQALGFDLDTIAIYRSDGSTQAIANGPYYKIEERIGSSQIFVDTGATLGLEAATDLLWIDSRGLSGFPYTTSPSFNLRGSGPSFMELHKNQMFYVLGNVGALRSSLVLFSDIGKPQQVRPTNNFEVRTDDGDYVSALKSYNDQLVITKQRSIHTLLGDDADNFTLKEVSSEYGCINNRSIVTFEGLCWFLGEHGINQYNGSKPEKVSYAMDYIFENINLVAGVSHALMYHNKKKNEIWTALPYNGATINNIVVAYDYLAKAWTTYEGQAMSAFMEAGGQLAFSDDSYVERETYYGGWSGLAMKFGASYLADNGVGFTVLAKSRFLSPLGHVATSQARRLYLDQDPIGASIGITVQAFADMGSSVIFTRTMTANAFQSRIDFGTPCKAISFQFSKMSTTGLLRIHGFAMGSRFQRND